jgi:hypothetical protein
MSDIKNRLMKIRGAKIIGLTAETQPRIRKSSPYADNVVKRTRYSGMVNFDYEKGVQRRQVAEGQDPTFKAQSSYHEPVLAGDGKMTPLSKHKTNGQEYVRLMPRTSTSEFVHRITGRIIPKEELEGHLVKSSNYNNQPAEKKLPIILVKLDNVRNVRLNGKVYGRP